MSGRSWHTGGIPGARCSLSPALQHLGRRLWLLLLFPCALGSERGGSQAAESGAPGEGKSECSVQEASAVTWNELRGALAPKAFTEFGRNRCLHSGFLLAEGRGCRALCRVLGSGSPPSLSCHPLAVGSQAPLFPHRCAEQCLPFCIPRAAGPRCPMQQRWAHLEHFPCRCAGHGPLAGGAQLLRPQIFQELHTILFIVASPGPVLSSHPTILGECGVCNSPGEE